jgi:hypothetical protein
MYGTSFFESNFVLNDVLDKSPFHYFNKLDTSFRLKLSKASQDAYRLGSRLKASQVEDAYRNQWESLLKRSKLTR